MHANKLRKFDVRVEEIKICCTSLLNDCDVRSINHSVIYEKDKDFGPIETVEPQSSNLSGENFSLPSQCIDPSRMVHLTELQRGQLLSVLDKYMQNVLLKNQVFVILSCTRYNSYLTLNPAV